jgi:hypothetical protein
MRLIDELRPELMVSLHNAELGGVYYYLSEDLPDAVGPLHAVPAALGLPLDTGEPESAALQRLAPAIYRAGSTRDEYDYLESLGLDAPAMVGGEGSAAYARRHGTVSLIAELPYWSHPSADDTSETDADYADVVRTKAEALVELGGTLTALLEEARGDLTLRSPFLRASESFVPMMTSAGTSELVRAGRLASRAATVAEVFSNEEVVRMFRLRFGGMLVRALEAEAGAGLATARLRRVHARAREVYDGWLADAQAVTGLEPLPVERLVGVQYGATLATSHVLAARGPGGGGGRR